MKKIIEEIDNWNKELSKENKKKKYEKMSSSDYIFFRGTNHLFWNYAAKSKVLNTNSDFDTTTWIQGDLHAYNYGIYDNDKNQLVYDINDFDESCISDYQYDLWRMAASIILIGVENSHTKADINVYVEEFVLFYLKTLKSFIKNNKLPKAVTEKNAYGKLDEVLEQIKDNKSRKKQLDDWTRTDNGSKIFDLDHPKLIEIDKNLKEEIKKEFANLHENKNFDENYFNILDIVQRVTSGTGSYGYPRYYVLIQGEANKTDANVILDVKLQTKPTACEYLENNTAKISENEGIRHMEAYKNLCKDTDNHLGYITLKEGSFSIRERSPYKSYFPTQVLNSSKRFKNMVEQWGKIIATAHLRAHDNFNAKKVIELNTQNNLAKKIVLLASDYNTFNAKAYKKFINHHYMNE